MSDTAMIPDSQGQRSTQGGMKWGAGSSIIAGCRGLALAGLMLAGLSLLLVPVSVAVAVLLDILLVRPVLLPAAEAVLGRAGWWPTAAARQSGPPTEDRAVKPTPAIPPRPAKPAHI